MARPKKNNRLKRVTISVDPNDYRRMESLGHDNGLSIAWLIRQSMKEFLDRNIKSGNMEVGIKSEK